ncbi:MAG: Holliday junction resolvase RuvX [Candidatus Aminicenantes bacterium]|jgi:putative Holliday junction resolvase
MRILGIDYGDRSIGLALSDKLRITAQAIGRYEVKSRNEDAVYFKDLVKHKEVTKIVIGLPLQMNGSEGPRAEKTRKFARWLEKTLGLPVVFWDERLTTKQALQVLHEQKMDGRKKKKLKDQVAATIILSDYLESERGASHVPENR